MCVYLRYICRGTQEIFLLTCDWSRPDPEVYLFFLAKSLGGLMSPHAALIHFALTSWC